MPPLQDEACLARWLKTITAFSSLAAQLLSSELSFVLSDWGDCPLMQLHLPAQLTQVCDNALQLLAQQLLLHHLYCNFAFWNHSVTYIVQSNLMLICLDVFIKMVEVGIPYLAQHHGVDIDNNSCTHKPDFSELLGNRKMFNIARLFTTRKFWLKHKWVEQWKKFINSRSFTI